MSVLKSFEQMTQALRNEENERRNKEVDKITKAKKDLAPVLEYLQPLSSKGINVSMHENPSHHPCPAIHIKRPGGGVIELYIDSDGVYRVGPCNRHSNTGIREHDIEELGEYIVKIVLRNIE